MLTDLAASAELFHTADGTAFADLMVDGHRETWPVRSIRMRSWLRRKYYEATGAAAGSGAINSALDLLEARAQFEAPRRAIYLRVAEHDGRIYLDLADELWRAIEIGPEGWRVITLPAGQIPQGCRHATTSDADERRIARGAHFLFQSCEPQTTSFWSSRGCWRHCDMAAPTRCWPFRASRDRQKRSSPKSFAP